MRPLILFATFLAFVPSARSQSAGELVKAATEAFVKKQNNEALKLVNQALKADPKNVDALSLRAEIQEAADKFTDAVTDWTRVIELDAENASAYQQRGIVQFKAGRIKESIADFDQYIERRPTAKISHWQRGISYYYAGRFEEGSKQFEGYQKFDSNDVENAVWRFMCMVRVDGIDKARTAILKIGDDRRVPMRQVYDLYKGDLNPEDVLAAANAGKVSADKRNSARFYAHLYIGIYYDLLNEKKAALEHLDKATDDYRIGHYMWDVARVHRDLLKAQIKAKK